MTESTSLWEFCVEIYDLPGVEDLCLHLQDHQHLPVTLLLWCAWLEMEGRPLSEETLAVAQDRAREMEGALLSRLRKLRRSLKAQEVFASAVEKEIRHHILAAELCVEKQLLTELQELSPAPSKTLTRPTPLERLAAGWRLPQAEPWLREIRAATVRVRRDLAI